MKTSILDIRQIKAESGFIRRLDEVIKLAGIDYGRQRVISQFSGLSLDGVKKMYQQDRPPRPQALNRLVSNIVTAFAEIKGCKCSPEEMKNYLLLGQGHASDLVRINKEAAIETRPHEPEFDIASFVNADPVYTSQVILKVEEIAQALNIDTSSGIHERHIRLIQYRIISFCHKNRPDVNSEKVASIIESLFELATQDML